MTTVRDKTNGHGTCPYEYRLHARITRLHARITRLHARITRLHTPIRAFVVSSAQSAMKKRVTPTRHNPLSAFYIMVPKVGFEPTRA